MKIQASEIVLESVERIVPNPKNMNEHSDDQIERLCKLIEYQGFRNPCVISKRTGFLVVGHGRLMAAKKLNMTEIPVIYQDFESEAQEYSYLVSDNAIAEWSDLDLSQINTEMIDMGPDFDIDMLGIKDFTIEPVEKFEPQGDEDHVPELRKDPITKLGDVWLLGDHRLMCGDSTMIDDVEKLMNGEKADITFTSPPYNAGKTPKENGKYQNNSDDLSNSDYLDFLNKFTTNSLLVSDYVFSNIQSISGNKVALIEHLYDMRSVFADTIIWNKGSSQPAMARRVLNSQFEYIHIFSSEGKRSIGKRDFRGTIPNIFELNSRAGKEYAKIHKATFRVELPEMFLDNFTESSCYEPFCGTGTTLIACEKKGRKCFGMELDPLYCDVVIERWEKFTGKKAELENGNI